MSYHKLPQKGYNKNIKRVIIVALPKW